MLFGAALKFSREQIQALRGSGVRRAGLGLRVVVDDVREWVFTHTPGRMCPGTGERMRGSECSLQVVQIRFITTLSIRLCVLPPVQVCTGMRSFATQNAHRPYGNLLCLTGTVRCDSSQDFGHRYRP